MTLSGVYHKICILLWTVHCPTQKWQAARQKINLKYFVLWKSSNYRFHIFPTYTLVWEQHTKICMVISSVFIFLWFSKGNCSFHFWAINPFYYIQHACKNFITVITSHNESNKPLTIFLWFTNYLLWFNKGKHSFYLNLSSI